MDFLASIRSTGSGLPSRVIVHGTEGVGKTSLAANAPGVVFLQSRGETGLETLIDAGRLSDTPHFPEAKTWLDAKGMLEALLNNEHSFRTLAIDTLNGLEKLCIEHTRRVFFEDDHEKFMSYGKGQAVAANEWRELITLLDEIRSRRRMAIIGLTHTKIRTFNNPEGSDYDRFEADMSKEIWGLTLRWSDMCLFANYVTAVSKEPGANKVKGKGGRDRVLYTERHAAYDAKNRVGLPATVPMGSSGAEAWANLSGAIKSARAANRPAEGPKEETTDTETAA
jgi:hypothetical protein